LIVTISFYFQEDAAAIEEFLAKKHKRGKKVEDKSFKEKSILHSNLNFKCIHFPTPLKQIKKF